jgi:uncharacterized Zn finger protein (UPF0148 family)
MFDNSCLNCRTWLTFPQLPGEAICPVCGLRVYATARGDVGRLPPADWQRDSSSALRLAAIQG